MLARSQFYLELFEFGFEHLESMQDSKTWLMSEEGTISLCGLQRVPSAQIRTCNGKRSFSCGV